MRMKKQILLSLAVLLFTVTTATAQSFEFRYQGNAVPEGGTVTIAAVPDEFGFGEYRSTFIKDLSLGSKRKAYLITGFALRPELLLLDEPVSGLDPMVTAEMYDLIESLNKEGITTIMISHDITAAIHYASHILHIGKKTFFGTKDDYIKSDIGKLFILQEGGETNV